MEDVIFCKGGGCTAKLGPQALKTILAKLEKKSDPNLLVGFESADDAAVYKVSDDIAIVQTLDFFPPMIEDPYIFGQIAATNALSDIYAMGGEVKTALNIVGFPEKMDLNILGKILQGGNEKVTEAGGVLSGGHSIFDDTVKYGLSVMGVIHPDKIFQNNTPKMGDKLILTKPLGVGISCTAYNTRHMIKDQKLQNLVDLAIEKAIKSMTTLNKYAADVAKRYRTNAMTDVTGFGFLGHLTEMIGTEFGAQIYAADVPYIEEAQVLADEFFITAAAQRNRNFVGDKIKFCNIEASFTEVLFDPQTSGGLLISINPADAQEALAEFKKLGLPCNIVGEIVAGDKIVVETERV
ncbi:selenide, water dikinase SelD [Candidatus Epulonipiscium viviparus]|uniref:selenide, water dikinase SelD n=1 Tax=Candidatus Epulonipiscium viviparus TaxID=420336 RepID=UPI0004975BBD|nr:selenide, water dikinase SelD [Candidatus Epulopiscium viviparus]